MMKRLIRESDRVCIVENLRIADHYFSRMKGLIGVKRFEAGEGLLISPCNNIHMWMMSVPIDAVFLKKDQATGSKKWRVTSVHPGLRPWKFLPIMDSAAEEVLEIPSGIANQFSIRPGEVLCIAS